MEHLSIPVDKPDAPHIPENKVKDENKVREATNHTDIKIVASTASTLEEPCHVC